MKITADFTNITGKIKPMHAVGQPPMVYNTFDLFSYLTEASIPYSRLHDVGGWYGGNLYVDIPNLFRDFDADETKEENYDFTLTDGLMAALYDYGIKPFFRLGVTIENLYKIKSYRIDPPKDFAKWARICEHVIRHYNEGWANGFRYGIEYWEIWNEPEGEMNDVGGAMWTGTKAQYLELYNVTSKHLRKCFGTSIKIGGPAAIGFMSYEKDKDLCGIRPENGVYTNNHDWWLDYIHDFLAYCRDNECPLDYFSWHSYCTLEDTLAHADHCQRVLDKYGFGHIEHILNEWNTNRHQKELHDTGIPCSKTLSMMLGMQKKSTAMLCYYDARCGISTYGGMFNPETKMPRKNYYAFRTFGRLYDYKNEVETASDDSGVYVGGATNGKKAVLAISNPSDRELECELCLCGVDMADADIIITDDTRMYLDTGKKIVDGKITLTPWSCTEIRLDAE
ncbi:MAG: hypothetical protein IKU43_03895 [Clostridia bacterium]|nr:hypothetical protein [Clostridia bacterium]